MPPPPPSKSYLLVIDTDSEDEDDQEERHWQRQQQLEQRQRQQQQQLQVQREHQQRQLQQRPAVIVPPSPVAPRNQQQDRVPASPEQPHASGHRRPHALEDFDTEDDDSEEGPFTASSSLPPCTKKDEQNDEPMITSTTSEDKEDDTTMACTITEEDDTDKDETTLLTKSQKKNKKKKRQHKKKKNRSGSPSEDDHEHRANKKDLRVTFSDVSIQNYSRCFGADVVPGDGGWPLGMELKPPGCTMEEKEEFRIQLPMEEYEAMKQERLQARWEIVQEKFPNEEAILTLMTQRPTNDPTPFALETRQWDYRSKVKNPLFRVLYEDDRRAIFLGQTVTAATPAPPTRRLRSASFEGGDIFETGGGTSETSSGSGSSNPPSKRRTRSNSVAESNSKSGGGAGSAAFSDTYDQVYVHHVRNELEQIRVQRSTEGAMGCGCRKLSVYIPPKDGGGKKAQHRRLKPQKLTQELKKRNLFDPKASREEMELVLHKAVQDEPCCGRDCPCHKDGVECQADTCSCWYDSHNQVDKKSNNSQGATTNSHNALALSEIQKRCGNQYGMNAVDGNAIDKKRVQVLWSLNLTYCQPVAAVV